MRLRSLRGRLIAGVIGVAAVSLIAFAVVLYAQQRAFLLDRIDEQAVAAGPLVGATLDDRGGPRPRGYGGRGGPPVGGGRRPALGLPPGVYLERRDAGGARIGSPVVLTYAQAELSPPKLPSSVPDDELITVSSQDGSLEYRVDAAPSPEGGSTIVAIPLSGVAEQLAELRLVGGLVVAGALLLMSALGWWVVRVGLRPLERIGATAQGIAGGDLSQRVEPAEPTTEIGRLGLALNGMLHQIEEAFAERASSEERLRRFLADAAHELRTPLASIRGYAELFRMGAADTAKAMSRIEQEAARMGVLVEDLLLLARLDEVRTSAREPIDVAALARDAVADARAMAPDRSIALTLSDNELVVLGDEDRLRQVIGNLMRNAIVHTAAGSEVELAVARVDDRVRIEVRDRGPGLPVDDGRVLFERFWRAEPGRTRGSGGVGLGLAIVDGIVRAHGGEVHAQDRSGGGAIFAVSLRAHDARVARAHDERVPRAHDERAPRAR